MKRRPVLVAAVLAAAAGGTIGFRAAIVLAERKRVLAEAKAAVSQVRP